MLGIEQGDTMNDTYINILIEAAIEKAEALVGYNLWERKVKYYLYSAAQIIDLKYQLKPPYTTNISATLSTDKSYYEPFKTHIEFDNQVEWIEGTQGYNPFPNAIKQGLLELIYQDYSIKSPPVVDGVAVIPRKTNCCAKSITTI